MPVEWPFADDVIRLGGVGTQTIAAEDGARQRETARSILRDLVRQPGVILADEVGMGKTYVALAVIASVVRATRGSGRPVVVMVPRGLADKWPREWQHFRTMCAASVEAFAWVKDRYVHTPTEFFKAIDGGRAARPNIIWMTTGCFDRGLSDPWTKLALVRLARGRTKLDAETLKAICKWATTLVRLKHSRYLTPDIVERLLRDDLSRWHHVLLREGILDDTDDDPIPQHLLQHQHAIDLSPLVAVIRGDDIPGRRGGVSDDRLRDARRAFNDACQTVYWDWLSRVRWHAPLLVLDEAHHAKNDQTRLASLFRSEETTRLMEAASEGTRPLLVDKFDRMLFLTATPFQLGHHELIRVLHSFGAARWTGADAPAGNREDFRTAMDQLEERLNLNRLAARRLDRLWGRLAHHVVASAGGQGSGSEAALHWWHSVRHRDELAPPERELIAAIDECRTTKLNAETDAAKPWLALSSWVIRHNRPTHLQRGDGSLVPRRRRRPGQAVVTDDVEPSHIEGREIDTGLPVAGDSALPFLLAARAQGELARAGGKARAYFAEGLASSYEAFHHTREQRGDARDVGDDGAERSVSRRQHMARDEGLVPTAWYEDQVQRLVPSRKAKDAERFTHPKMRADVQRTVRLWREGEKVLMFCFYRETARALREHVGREIQEAILSMTAEKLGQPEARNSERLRRWFELVARRLGEEGSPFQRAIVTTLRSPFEKPEFSILRPREEELIQLLEAYVRSPSFLSRYLPLDVSAVREALWTGSTRPQVVRAGADALSRALAERTDASAMSFVERIEEFLRFAKELAERAQMSADADDEERPDPLTEYLKAVAVYVSARQSGDDDDALSTSRTGSYRALQPVRMVYGDTAPAIRSRLMLAFNSPMLPDVLISSAVLGEGVDLHRFCRYVIHHDLNWNPSTLEQRTGRLDRIRCKAENAGLPIVVYEPYLGGSADERMFRVVRDRERWFQIVMGQKFEFDEATVEELANRVPLPEEVANTLIFDLRRYRPRS